jgi:predicted  nucleic acid-binding Zn-ribbon protein
MKNISKNKTGNENNATAALAKINAEIEKLNQQRIGLSEPLKDRFKQLTGELATLSGQIRELDPTWKPASLKPKAQDKIAEIITVMG